jgi:long-chain acyl-CoA synthetase
MYPGTHAEHHPDQPAIIMAESGEVTTFAAFEAMANRIAHWFRRSNLRRGDHVLRKVFWDNAARLYNVKAAI